MPEVTFRVNSLTSGTPSHKFEHLRKNYVYGGDKTAEDDRPDPPPGGPRGSQARAGRMAVFAAAWAKKKNLTEAAKAAGVTLPTARAYRRALEQQGGSHD